MAEKSQNALRPAPVRFRAKQVSGACGGGEGTAGYTDWTWNNAGPQCSQSYPTTYYVQVFSNGTAATCMDFTLTAFIQ